MRFQLFSDLTKRVQVSPDESSRVLNKYISQTSLLTAIEWNIKYPRRVQPSPDEIPINFWSYQASQGETRWVQPSLNKYIFQRSLLTAIKWNIQKTRWVQPSPSEILMSFISLQLLAYISSALNQSDFSPDELEESRWDRRVDELLSQR